MKALKTVAVALGITLAALIVIPLVVLAGLFVWLKVTEEQRGGSARARSRRRLIDEPDAAAPRRRGGHDRAIDARRRPGGRFGVRRPPLAPLAASGASPRSPSSSVMVLWAANFIVVKSALAVLPPVGFTFLRFVARLG